MVQYILPAASDSTVSIGMKDALTVRGQAKLRFDTRDAEGARAQTARTFVATACPMLLPMLSRDADATFVSTGCL